jgi:putative heme iron utilization protein
LVAEGGEADPLANGRVTMLGACRLLADSAERSSAKDAYLVVHPNAEYYIDYKDFGFWRLEVDSVRYIGGYGRMSWVETDDWRSGPPDEIAPHARGIIEHMNADPYTGRRAPRDGRSDQARTRAQWLLARIIHELSSRERQACARSGRTQ